MSPPNTAAPGVRLLRRWLTPSLVDFFFVAMFLLACARPGNLQVLLSDGDTGWHIRTGEQILTSGHVPRVDDFSFTRAGKPWFAWEWLSEVVFAAACRWRGLAAVAAVAGAVLALAAAVLFARLLRRGVGLWIALAATMAAVSASSVHYLARPHVFSILLYTVTLGAIENDRRRPSWRLWLLVPLAALWANLHAAFVALPATLLLAAACAPGKHNRWCYLRVALASAAATLCNPYGWQLHRHIWQYLNAPWILDHVQEFQSPSIRSEGTVVFALLLLTAVALAGRAGRGNRFEAALVLVWGFAALRSARHIPLFAIAAAPVVATAAAQAWSDVARRVGGRSPRRILWDLSQEFGRRAYATAWLPVAAAALVAAVGSAAANFSDARFPVRAVERYTPLLTGARAPARVLTSDQWADYLIYRLYPRGRVFFDGRSDFYGAALGADYRCLLAAEDGWRSVLDRYAFTLALLPHDWALSTALDREPGWRLVYRDPVAVLYARKEVAP